MQVFQIQSTLLGYLVSVDGVQPLPEELEAIKKLLASTNMDELHQFLGITGFYRKFVPFYANITNCLTKLLRKGTEYQWFDQCNNAFNILKEEVCKCHLYSTQTLRNHSSCLQMHPITAILASFIRPKMRNKIN